MVDNVDGVLVTLQVQQRNGETLAASVLAHEALMAQLYTNQVGFNQTQHELINVVNILHERLVVIEPAVEPVPVTTEDKE